MYVISPIPYPRDTPCHTSKHPEEKPAIEFINDVFNPAERYDMVDKMGSECKEVRQY
jgi:hypothetical protein